MRPTTERTKRVSDTNLAAAAMQKEVQVYDGHGDVPAALAHLLSPSSGGLKYPKRPREVEDDDERFLLASPFASNNDKILPQAPAPLQYSINAAMLPHTYQSPGGRGSTSEPHRSGPGRSPRDGKPRNSLDPSTGMLPEGGWLTYEPQTAGVEEEEDEADEDEDGDEGGSEEEEDGEDDDQESDFEEDSESAEAAAGVPDPDTPRAFKRRKIKGNSGDCNPSDVGKIVFDDCETADPRYRQPRMVIVADISKTATYKTIQFRSQNSLQKSGTSERYKDRTQSLLELLEDKSIIWAKVLPAAKGTREGGICGPCQHYGKECIVPLKKTSARDSNGPGYKILSICLHCKLYHTCDLNSSVKYMSFKPGNGSHRVGFKKGKSKVVRTPFSSKPAPTAASKTAPPNGIPVKPIDCNGLPPPTWHKSSMATRHPPSRASPSRPTRTASAPTARPSGPPPTRVSARIQQRVKTEQLEAELDDSEDESAWDEEVSSRNSRAGPARTNKIDEEAVKEEEEEDEDGGPLGSLRSFVSEMKRREREKKGGKLDYPTRVMFEKAEQDLVKLEATVDVQPVKARQSTTDGPTGRICTQNAEIDPFSAR